MRRYFIYILSSRSRTLYTGMTGNLARRISEHKAKQVPGFTKRYNITRLVYLEPAPNALAAIAREKQIKAWRREKKIRLIESLNPEWINLADSVMLR